MSDAALAVLRTKPTRRFLFSGSSYGLTGQIRRPEQVSIPTQACAVLADTGGLAEDGRIWSSANKFNRYVTYRTVSSYADGDYADKRSAEKFTHGNFGENRLPTRTTVRALVEGLQIFNLDSDDPRATRSVSAEVLSFGLESTTTDDEEALPNIVVTDAQIAGLRFDDYELNVTLTKSFGTARNPYDFFEGGQAASFSKGRPDSPKQTVDCTLVESLTWKDGRAHPDIEITGNRIVFHGFGEIYLAELQISDRSKKISMLRAHLGSPSGGEVSASGGETNGQYHPPN